MATVMINGKAVEVKGVSIEKLTTERPQGSKGEGVTAAIRQLIDAAASDKTPHGVLVTELEKTLKKLFPSLVGQARQRVTNFVRNSNGKYLQLWDEETGKRTVVRADAAKRK
jgi:hypothetical protein